MEIGIVSNIMLNPQEVFNPHPYIRGLYHRAPEDKSDQCRHLWENMQMNGIKELDLNDIELARYISLMEEIEIGMVALESWRRIIEERGDIPLNGKVLQAFEENPSLVPESWYPGAGEKNRKLYFLGTILEDPYGYRGAFNLALLDDPSTRSTSYWGIANLLDYEEEFYEFYVPVIKKEVFEAKYA